jgi:hypothetical protein
MFNPRTRKVLRWTSRIVALVFLLVAVGALFWLRGALYNHYVRFPREVAALAALQAARQPVTERTLWNEYRGILHSHSHLSHDCEVPFAEILRVLKATDRDFLCLSDHCTEGRADFSAQWRGLHDGKLFIPGFEMKDGFMPFGVQSQVTLTNGTAPDVLARQIVDHGGVLFYAHPEEPRDWEQPLLTGMEIYNLHAQFKHSGGFRRLLPELLVNQRRYPDRVLDRILGGPAPANLRRWDELNQTSRHITGIAGNDCHQNAGVRVIYTASGSLRIEDTSPAVLREIQLNAVTRWLVRLCVGPLTPDRKLWHLQLDPYDRLTRFVSTHLLARELTEPAILDSLKAGRAFVGFDGLADSTGFMWMATNAAGAVVMGESLPWAPGTLLHAVAPQSCRFTILRHGQVVHQALARSVDWAPPRPGVYRVEAELNLCGQWKPWIFSNPIWIEGGGAEGQVGRRTPPEAALGKRAEHFGRPAFHFNSQGTRQEKSSLSLGRTAVSWPFVNL